MIGSARTAPMCSYFRYVHTCVTVSSPMIRSRPSFSRLSEPNGRYRRLFHRPTTPKSSERSPILGGPPGWLAPERAGWALSCLRPVSHGCNLYLKSLKLVGFKSFADRTVLEFEPGVSVVVGPNGTGKSNIVDALAWVMGAQFTKGLRTDRMDEVVFAGTATRAAFARAEVTAVFDNRGRILPLELDEVSLTRRLFRGGSSEYEINGVECRLLDIQDLLSDSGVGRSQHMIVGQGRLESILTAQGDQRRRMIEEAAGILKHQLRKAKAMRRLERTDADILRLHDIIGEIERRMRPLRRQAAGAERHDLILTELRTLRLWLGGQHLIRLRRRSGALTDEQTQLETGLTTARSRLAGLEGVIDRMGEESAIRARALARDTAAAARLDTVAARLRGIAQVARERAGGLTTRIAEAGTRRRHLEEETERLSDQLDEAADHEERARRAARAGEDALSAAEDRMRSLRSIPERPALKTEAELLFMRSDLQSVEAASARDTRDARDLARRIETVEARAADEVKQAERLEEELHSTLEELNPTRELGEAKTAALESQQTEWERRERRLRSAEAERMAAVAKAEAIEAAAGHTRATARKRLADSDGMIGALTALLDVPEDLVAAVEAAVGAWVEALVFDDVRGLRRAVGVLRSEGLGSLPLVAAPPANGEPRSLAVSRHWRVEALLDRLGPAADRAVAVALLGDVVLVEGWSTGWDVVQRDADVRAVTPEGDLVTCFGIQPFDPDRATPGLIGAARREVDAARSAEDRAKKAAIESRTALEAARREAQSVHERIAALESAHRATAAALERLQKVRVSRADEIAGLQARLSSVRRTNDHRGHRLAELRARIEATQAGLISSDPSRESWVREREAAEEAYAAERLARDNAIRALGAAVERRRMLDDRLARVRAQVSRLDHPTTEPFELKEARSVEVLALRALEVVRAKLAELAVRTAGLNSEIAAADRRLTVARGRASEVTEAIETARERLAELSIAATEIRMREESVCEALRRDADASEEQALAAERPQTGNEDPVARAASLTAELARMGPINPLATEEFRELDERYGLLSGQIEDLETSRTELDKVTAALDAEMESLFSQTFDEAAHHFRRFFTVLFPGGTGRLILTNPENPLASGVEIEAQPLGKKVDKLALLSGGERSLAALGFLFAVFRARPAPFYMLDEADAALDDSNLRRFLRLVDEFRDHAQLIVITHQQVTVRAADVLYGVTMAPGGSSKALVKRMDKVGLPA